MYKSRFWHLYIFQKQPPKIVIFSFFLKGRYFWQGGRKKMNLSMFWETYLGFVKMLFHNFFHDIANFTST